MRPIRLQLAGLNCDRYVRQVAIARIGAAAVSTAKSELFERTGTSVCFVVFWSRRFSTCSFLHFVHSIQNVCGTDSA